MKRAEVKQLIDCSRHEAGRRLADHVGPEHLLIALSCVATGRLREALIDAGVTPSTLRDALNELDERALAAIGVMTVPTPESDDYRRAARWTDGAKDAFHDMIRSGAPRGSKNIDLADLALALLRRPPNDQSTILFAQLGVDRSALAKRIVGEPAG